MPAFKDLTGQKFNHFTVIKLYGRRGKNGSVQWKCQCDCGLICIIDRDNLVSGKSKSCGCFYNKKRFSKIIEKDCYCEVELTKGFLAIIDKEDSEKVSKYVWHITSTGYAVSNTCGKILYMQNLIMNNFNKKKIDHCDRNKLNNRKKNLREATRGQNAINSVRKNSKVRGVYFQRGAYVARVCFQLKSYYCGRFKEQREAGFYRDKVAIIIQNDFAYLNFPERKQEILDWLQTEEGQLFKKNIETKLNTSVINA